MARREEKLRSRLSTKGNDKKTQAQARTHNKAPIEALAPSIKER